MVFYLPYFILGCFVCGRIWEMNLIDFIIVIINIKSLFHTSLFLVLLLACPVFVCCYGPNSSMIGWLF